MNLFTSKNKNIKIDRKVKLFEKRSPKVCKYGELDLGPTLCSKYLISSAGNHFYECGLSFYKIGDKKRSKLLNPFFVFTIESIVVIRYIVSLLMPEEYERVFVMMADFAHILNARSYLNPILIFAIIPVQVLQFWHFLDYKQNKRPVYLKPFEVISGKSSPNMLGLTNKRDVIILFKIMKYGLVFGKHLIISLIIMVSMIAIIPIALSYHWTDIIVWGIPWTVCTVFCVVAITQMWFFNNLYIFYACYYLMSKLKSLHNEIRDKTQAKHRNFSLIQTLMRKSHNIINEINLYNDYWSKYNFCLMAMLIGVTNLLLFETIFFDMSLIIRVMYVYGAFVSYITFLSVLKINTIVLIEAKKTYKLFSQLYLAHANISPVNKLKVNLFLKF